MISALYSDCSAADFGRKVRWRAGGNCSCSDKYQGELVLWEDGLAPFASTWTGSTGSMRFVPDCNDLDTASTANGLDLPRLATGQFGTVRTSQQQFALATAAKS